MQVKDHEKKLLEKAAIYEAELTFDPTVQSAAPLFTRLDADTTLSTMLSLFVPQLHLASHAIKLQINQGLACFSITIVTFMIPRGPCILAILHHPIIICG